MPDRLILARFARCPRVLGRGGERRGKNDRERKKERGASSCRSVLRFDVGNHAPHSPSAAEIFGFIVCEGLSPNREESSPELEGRKKRSRETQGEEDVARKEGEKEDHADEEGER